MVEVYHGDGRAIGHCAPHVVGDSVEELRRALAMTHEAFEKPVLVPGDFRGPREVTQAGGAESGASLVDPGDEG